MSRNATFAESSTHTQANSGDMSVARLIQGLGGYMMAAALFGTIRTGSIFPIMILGSIGLITIGLGWMTSRGSRIGRRVTLAWLTVNVIVEGYQAFWRLPSHPQAREGSAILFGSVALLALIVLIVMISRYQRIN